MLCWPPIATRCEVRAVLFQPQASGRLQPLHHHFRYPLEGFVAEGVVCLARFAEGIVLPCSVHEEPVFVATRLERHTQPARRDTNGWNWNLAPTL